MKHIYLSVLYCKNPKRIGQYKKTKPAFRDEVWEFHWNRLKKVNETSYIKFMFCSNSGLVQKKKKNVVYTTTKLSVILFGKITQKRNLGPPK